MGCSVSITIRDEKNHVRMKQMKEKIKASGFLLTPKEEKIWQEWILKVRGDA